MSLFSVETSWCFVLKSQCNLESMDYDGEIHDILYDCQTSGIPVSEICEHRFLLHDKDATQHIFEVSAGLDSLVLGEGQILAQVKQVVKVAVACR